MVGRPGRAPRASTTARPGRLVEAFGSTNLLLTHGRELVEPIGRGQFSRATMEGCILHGRSARSATAARLGRWSRHLARPISHKSTVKNWSSQLVAANLVEPGRGWSDRFFPKGIQRPGSSGCNGGVHFALNHKVGASCLDLGPFGRATLRLSPRQVEEKNPPFLSDGFPDEFRDHSELILGRPGGMICSARALPAPTTL